MASKSASDHDTSRAESGHGPSSVPYWRLVWDQGLVTPEIENWPYKGSGTVEDPYAVVWIDNDPRNPQLFSTTLKWALTMLVAIATLAVAFVSSAYSGGANQIVTEFGVSEEVFTLGISLFVLGFAIGPLLWAPLSELFGRQILYIGTYAMLTIFNAGAAGANSMATLIVLRFLAGTFGASPLTNAGGVIADLHPAEQRGLALALFASAPFLGPVLGPICGGFIAETIGWRWVEGVMAIFCGVLWIIGSLLVPETYSPVLLRKRAKKLSKMTGKVYKSKSDIDQGDVTFSHVFASSLSRPWLLLFKEPIVLALSIYMAIVYGTLYMLFTAFPIVYQQERGWSEGIGGLAFLGVAVGIISAVAYAAWDNKRYAKISRKYDGFAPPEARLPTCMVGGIAIVVGLFWFAWTCSPPSIPFMASIAAGVPFGFGMVLIFLSIMNYLIDSYVIFAASVLAANSVLRSLFGAAFPLFTTYMYRNLGSNWASSIPAFLALACIPFPFLFYKYGAAIRERCKYAAQAKEFLIRLQNGGDDDSEGKDADKDASDGNEKGVEADQGASDDGADSRSRANSDNEGHRFEEIKTGNGQVNRSTSQRSNENANSSSNDLGLHRTKSYQGNPYDIDRVATKSSFKGRNSRTASVKSGKSGRSGK